MLKSSPSIIIVSLIGALSVSCASQFTSYKACGGKLPISYCVQAGFLNSNPSFMGPQKPTNGKFRCFNSAGEISGQCCPNSVTSYTPNPDPKFAQTVPKKIAADCTRASVAKA
ncbi:hypothetical protein PTTG_08463 [Puccinia triticina 1-1 BBBD Race 1]|uniref:Secreted protein n=2 Tax=Puccinia triticina TaxID=208348 RepID=A0A180G6E4_PUCT1|nr:uncharacterized protein PtA15_15A27 [Puccinia triticina]OAV88257.1 hypothetical protein PTTG_08463 [Puccinia triticina 1-1 BBBD Race 1]WAQ91638.1 hypothetical protein PtA15_15A27 [Puccinia triticina]WAR62437.1 hypothetical protein PtB15_15B21 [Puccinia triticina]